MHQHYDKFDPIQDRDNLDIPDFMFRDGVKKQRIFISHFIKIN